VIAPGAGLRQSLTSFDLHDQIGGGPLRAARAASARGEPRSRASAWHGGSP